MLVLQGPRFAEMAIHRLSNMFQWLYTIYLSNSSQFLATHYTSITHPLHIPSHPYTNQQRQLILRSLLLSRLLRICRLPAVAWQDALKVGEPWGNPWGSLKPSGKCSLPLLARNPKPFQKGTSWLYYIWLYDAIWYVWSFIKGELVRSEIGLIHPWSMKVTRTGLRCFHCAV